MAENIEDQILENALAPKIVEGDEGRIEEHSIDQLIKADQYLKNKAAMASGRGFRIALFKPGSAIGGQ